MEIEVLILIVAAIVMITFKRLGQPLVLGYLVAGFLVSPNMPYMQQLGLTPAMNHEIKEVGEMGVIVIMFCLGLEFSFKKLGRMGAAPFITAGVVILSMITLGFFMGNLMGWAEMDCIFLGGMLSMSSTAIIYKAFDELKLSGKGFTSQVMSVLILEDIIGVVLLVMLSAKAKGASDISEIIGTIVGLLEFLGVSLILGLIILPWFLRKIRKIYNEEMLLIISCALMVGLAALSQKLGFSTAFGAFIMGSILAETQESHKIEHCVMPLKNYLGAIFFVSVGMMVDSQILVNDWGKILILVLTIILGQMVFGTIAYALGGMKMKDAFRSGFSMTQIGEFSFIIAGVGVACSAINDTLYPVIVAVSVITTFTTPYMMRAAEPAYNLFAKLVPASFIEKLDNRGSNTTKKERKGQSFFGRLFNKLYDHAKMQTGNLPRHCGNELTASQLIVAEGDLFDGKTLASIKDLQENPYEVIGYCEPDNEYSWIDITVDHVFTPGERIWTVEKKHFADYQPYLDSTAQPPKA
ncbi:MAG: cation:proton antiporter [Muribaculaceae bacterium]|nr:cation:proton antiporter [Muribaculaceae bacterium]